MTYDVENEDFFFNSVKDKLSKTGLKKALIPLQLLNS